MLKSKGADPKVAVIFYRAVTQEVILFGLYTWFLLVEMERTVEGTHTGFLRHIMGERVQRKADGEWITPKEEVVR